MSKKKNKFDLNSLVHDGHLKDGQFLFFVSDPSKKCKITKQPNGDYKVTMGPETMTIHAFSQKCLGEDPPDHATKWVRNEAGQTLYDLWHSNEMLEAA